jgi:DNA repair protein RadC
MTQNIASLAKPMGISVHDHLIIGRNGHASLRALKLF